MVIAIYQAGKKVCEIIFLGKARELTTWMDANIDQSLDPMCLQQGEKLLGCLFCEADRIQSHRFPRTQIRLSC